MSNPKHPRDTDKLGPVEDHDIGSRFPADMPRRIPGWHADTQNHGRKVLFPEEALLSEAKGFEPFVAFYEDPAGAPNPNWLGANLPDLQQDPTDFNLFVHEVAHRVRRYNAALHWMRRLHFTDDASSGATKFPGWNRKGDKREVVNKNDADFQELVDEACADWDLRVKELNTLINGGAGASYDFGFHDTIADMVEVNGYIISMRLISTKTVVSDSKSRPFQIGGSSSSYVYISSPYSSSGINNVRSLGLDRKADRKKP